MTSRQISRKQFLGIGAGATAGVALAGSAMGTFVFTEEAQAVTTAVRLTPFQDALPIPPVLDTRTTSPSLDLPQTTTHQFHSSLAAVPVWGYNGGGYSGYLGPTIQAFKGPQVTVSYSNNLPRKHLLNVDPTITQMRGKPVNTRILTHLHGGHISPEADGNPYATPDEILSGQTQPVNYQNDQEAAHLWYHDHALGITRLNVMAGLAGHYLVRDDVDDGQGGNFPNGTLPSGDYEIPLVIQDRAFAKDGRIRYPAQWTPEFFGDVVCVNGKVWPNLQVDQAKYRFRMLNGSNSRFYHLQLTQGTMTQIGTDGGLLNAPVEDSQRILLAPGERADVIIDFSGFSAEDQIQLTDSLLPDGTVSPATPLARNGIIMQFTVTSNTGPAEVLPTTLRSEPFLVPGPVEQTRYLTLEEVLAGPVPRAVLLNGMHFADPVTERPSLNSIEDWWLVNLSADTHPIHVHLVQFEIVERRELDVPGYQAALTAARNAAGGPFVVDQQTNQATLVTPENPEQYFPENPSGNPPVDDNEKGPKDTVRANPMQATHIRAHFEPPAGETPPPAKYVWHCHILEHEDNDMMRPYDVV